MKLGSFSRPLEVGSKNSGTEVESLVLLGIESQPLHTRKRLKNVSTFRDFVNVGYIPQQLLNCD